LYIIYTMVFEASASDVDVPVVISPTNDKAEIRENFIILNTSESKGGGKKDLDPLDLFSQKVFGVRMDNSNKLDWLAAERKQRLLESADLFLTSSAYQNTTDDGAITHVSNIIDEAEPIVEQFCKYWNQRKTYEVRHVETKEIIMLCEFFRACADDPSVVVDDKFIADVTKIFWNSFECEFTGQKGLNIFWRKLDGAYQNWYDAVYKEPEIGQDDLRPTRYIMTNNGKWQNTYGVTFLIFLLKKNGFKQTLPKPPTEFKPAKADLW